MAAISQQAGVRNGAAAVQSDALTPDFATKSAGGTVRVYEVFE